MSAVEVLPTGISPFATRMLSISDESKSALFSEINCPVSISRVPAALPAASVLYIENEE